MDIVRSWRDVPAELKGAVLAIGNFDGVHRGHQEVLRAAIDIAKAEGCRSGAVVFEPHPREFFAPDTPFFRLTPLPLKLELLEALGLDQTFVIPFDRELASLSARDLRHRGGGQGLGRQPRGGGPRLLLRQGPHRHDRGARRARPRARLRRRYRRAGRRRRDHLFVEPYSRPSACRRGEATRPRSSAIGGACAGSVEEGAGRGKGLGFPTLNLKLAPGQDVRHGIYAMRVDHDGARYQAAGYVGTRPTFGDGEPVLEAYLLDFAGDLYGQEVEAEFIAFLRPDRDLRRPRGACRANEGRLRSRARRLGRDRCRRSDAPLSSSPRFGQAGAVYLIWNGKSMVVDLPLLVSCMVRPRM